jgi:hypothetical protein
MGSLPGARSDVADELRCPCTRANRPASRHGPSDPSGKESEPCTMSWIVRACVESTTAVSQRSDWRPNRRQQLIFYLIYVLPKIISTRINADLPYNGLLAEPWVSSGWFIIIRCHAGLKSFCIRTRPNVQMYLTVREIQELGATPAPRSP